MTDIELTNLSQSILEIIAEQRDLHILVIKGQIQQINKAIGLTISDEEFKEAIQLLENNGLITELESKPMSYIVTSKGKDYI